MHELEMDRALKAPSKEGLEVNALSEGTVLNMGA